MQNKKHKFNSAKDLLLGHNFLEDKMRSAKYVTKEFQDFGYRLAVQLGDLNHKALYIKLAKNTDRRLLEQALSFTLDYPQAKNRGRIFMWKLKELRTTFSKEKVEKAKKLNKEQQKLFKE